MPGQEPRKGNAPGRAVKVGEPGGRLAEELKVMQVSASAQGGKNIGSFHNKVLFRFNFPYQITIRYYVNNIFKILSSYDNNFTLVAGLVALGSRGNRRSKPGRAFSGLQSGPAALKDRERLKRCPEAA